MPLPSNTTRKRLLIMLIVVSIAIIFLTARLGYIQIVKGEELKKGALQQWTKGIEIKAKRGVIYDRNGKKLAVSVSSYTVWASPVEIEDPEKTAKQVAEILDLEEEDVYKKLTKKSRVEKIKQWISKEEATALRKANLHGIEVVDDNKRYYPFGNFASHILGFTDIDNNGLYGIEKTYDKYLNGTPGKWIKTTDSAGRQLPYGSEKYYEAQDGLSVVLTIDETIQHFAEKAASETLVKNNAKNVSVLVMEPNTGDVLAMATKPDYDPNNPKEPLDENTKNEWAQLPQKELEKRWYDMWRNFPINDAYEPGSTFKIITSSAGLEENVVTPESKFYCSGYINDIPGAKLKCWRYYNPHGSQTFVEGVQNSCNSVFVELGRRLGNEKMYKYIKAFGFGEPTGIDLPGEQGGIIPSSPDAMKEVNLATISYGQGIAVTPIQLVTAISAVANGGNLMKPRLVKELIDQGGNVVHSFKPEAKRKVISNETSKTLLQILESVVKKGTGKQAYVPGYRIGGKTGTASKVIDGRYVPGKYTASFAGIAPVDDPKVVVLVIIDEPSNGEYYGGRIAGPVAGELIKEILDYLEVEPQFTEEEAEEYNKTSEVPDVRNKSITEAGKILIDMGFKYNIEAPQVQENSMVVDQFPLPGTKVNVGSIIDLYLEDNKTGNDKVVMPDLKGKSKEEVKQLLDKMKLQYSFSGEGNVISQSPKPGTEIDENIIIDVEFSEP